MSQAQPTALIADDEPLLLRSLAQMLQQLWPQLRIVATAKNGLEAAAQIEQLRPDVAFLDIKMPGLTGVEVVQQMTVPTRVVFVTAYDAYAVQAFEHAAVDYVLKPLSVERLTRTIERVRTSLQTSMADSDERLLAAMQKLLPSAASTQAPLRFIRAAVGDVMRQVDVDQVLFFHADEKYTCVQTADAEHLIRTPLAELAAQLDATYFVQVHRSTIVNLRYLEGTRRDEASRLFVRVRGHATELPVSRAYVHHFKAM